MAEPIIELKHVTMRFSKIRCQYGLRSMFLHFISYLHDLLHREQFVALDDVSLTIRKGERVAIVGANGSGKTTLLSIIGGVYRRFEGELLVNGKIAMMLALGAGFSKQLSGRDNILLNGVLQGKSIAEMRRLSQDVIDFADIGEFIDAPLYQYSSGMRARLGFGVATAIEPDILLVDEVMAVGDRDFKTRCEKRINDLLRKGTTMILVSHSSADIKKYCKRVIKLAKGRIVYDGVVQEDDR